MAISSALSSGSARWETFGTKFFHEIEDVITVHNQINETLQRPIGSSEGLLRSLFGNAKSKREDLSKHLDTTVDDEKRRLRQDIHRLHGQYRSLHNRMLKKQPIPPKPPNDSDDRVCAASPSDNSDLQMVSFLDSLICGDSDGPVAIRPIRSLCQQIPSSRARRHRK